VQHEQSLQLESLVVGGFAHTFCESYGKSANSGPLPGNVVALTNTGIAAPVLKLNTRWPRTIIVSVFGYVQDIETTHLAADSQSRQNAT
jgi:hypothetical protein